MAFPATPLDVTVELAIGADLTADPATWSFTDWTPKTREIAAVTIVRGRRSRFGQVTPTTVTAVVEDSAGDLSRFNPNSANYGLLKKNTPMRVSVDNGSGPVVRAAVFVPGFPPSWDPSESDFTVTLNGVGLTDRLGRSRTARSAPYRYLSKLTNAVPVASWLLEEGPLVNRAEPLYGAYALQSFVGTHPSGAVITYPQWGRGTLAPWLPPVMSRSSSAGLTAMWAPVSMPGFTNTWTVDLAFTATTDAPISVVDVNPSYLGGGSVGWPQLTIDPSSQSISVSFDGSPETTTDALTLFDGLVHHVRWTATQTGADIAWTVYVDSESVNSGTEVTATLPAMTKIGFVTEAGTAQVALGYASVWTTPEPVADYTAAVLGHRGEMAHERFARLCAEEGIQATVTATTSQAMGPQGLSRVLDLLRECGNTDVGLVFENMEFGLTFVSSSERYHLDAAVTLQYDQRHIRPPWQPDDDSKDYWNTVDGRQSYGSLYSASDQNAVDEVGEYGVPVTANVELPSQLADVTGWVLHLGLTDELTWPAVKPNLFLGGSLLDDWLAADLGQQLHVTGHPHPLAPDTIRQVIEGYTETLRSFSYDATAVLSPASPWDVTELDDSNTAKLDTAGCVMQIAAASGATSFTVATTDGPPWTTSPAQMPIPVVASGQVNSVTAISTVTPSFVSAGTVAHGNNASVTPTMPASVQAGDLLLVWAAIRNSGTGTVNTPSGYTVLAQSGNTKLLGKIHTGTEVAPTITFAGGVANADTSAQMAAFRGCGITVVNSATQLNGSAQNIAYPYLQVRRDKCLILYLGWKQDDWTSVATISSATEIGEPDTTTGDDQGIVWDYLLQSSAADISAGSFTVTGGASAISRGITVALSTDVQTMTVTRGTNGVTKAIPLGTSVNVHRPARAAL